MTTHQFIFSKKSPICYYRHVAFWFMVYLFFVFPKGFVLLLYNQFSVETLYPGFGFIIILLLMLTVYPLVYKVVPGFARQKNRTKVYLQIMGIFILSYLLIGLGAFWEFRSDIGKTSILLVVFSHTVGFLTAGPPVFSLLFLTVKMLKNYMLKMEEKRALEKETASAELQLLKAQIHPHFLFNTLNNIYSFTLNKSPQAAGLVLKLSDTLKYMINDCEAEMVPLRNEVKMLQDYIGLEQVRYGKRLKLDVSIIGDCENKLVAPLLLIPFVENSFKHGSSKMLDHPWIKMELNIINNLLKFKISNSKPVNQQLLNGLGGLGLKNVRKRLELLYPEEHQLEVTAEDRSFHVILKFPLYAKEIESIAEVKPAALISAHS